MHWTIEAARPRTLPAAIAPVLVGTAAAHRALVELSAHRLVFALLVALALQVAVNYANDLFDGVSGVDTDSRVGPRRVVAAGLVSPTAMAAATGVALGVAGGAGLALAWIVGTELLVVGAVAIVAALGYSGGRRPYASLGLGEVSVFVFFGLVATVGSQYVQDEYVGGVAVAAAVPVGAIAVALLVVNNLRDIGTDTRAGKRTLAVRLGPARTRLLYRCLLLSAATWVVPVALAAASPWPLAALAAVPLIVTAERRVAVGDGAELVGALEATARVHLVLAVLLAAGLVLPAWP